MSDCPPIASRNATAKILRQEKIPRDVGYTFDFCQGGRRAKFHSVPIADVP
jgi:hypothetical protein